jgi:hypothetical protein
MFLAETLAKVCFHQPVSKILQSNSENLVHGIQFNKYNSCEIINNYELFSFEKTALLAASDINLDKPDSIENFAKTIFQKKRKVFIAANYTERKNGFSSINIHNRESNLIDIGDPVRIGNLIDVKGNGIASIRASWTTPKRAIKEHLNQDKMKSIGIDKSDFKYVENISSLNFSSFEILVDTNKTQSITLKEFQEKLNEEPKEKDIDGIIKFIQSKNLQHGKSIEKRAWQLYRMNKFSQFNLPESSMHHLAQMTNGMSKLELDGFLDTLKDDLNGELLFSIAMLVVLEIDNLDIRYSRFQKERNTKKSFHKNQKSIKSAEALDKNLLGVVSINLDPELMTEIYHSKPLIRKETNNKQNRKSPSLHIVRGHLFRARNGNIVYRKPHWRGKQTNTNVIKRVR